MTRDIARCDPENAKTPAWFKPGGRFVVRLVPRYQKL